jgi:hypothetical protein
MIEDLAFKIAGWLGYFAGVFFMVVWIPMSAYIVTNTVKKAVLSLIPEKKTPKKQRTKTSTNTVKTNKETKKERYSVIENYRPEYKIKDSFGFKD